MGGTFNENDAQLCFLEKNKFLASFVWKWLIKKKKGYCRA